ncbi:leucyl aminopeptidase [Buchnera aphidicola (Melanaphis sacchari)]|uniref:Probable cytosol aminopeptidase n=1 Tax=Buchnera aphidicola (Melanaphis sacchari) TaxID=2173854 RepID=A0A2U8DF43_9GAMM|nr:leucyl aminopeptidase [Buchnera aphidicola]AWH90428.1 leucyl aminopeptidase [Buchnera aphidicola (Melanaphis sacchari)]
MKFYIKKFVLEKEQTDCIIIGIFESHDLLGSADHLNKCSNNYIGNLIKSGDIAGKIGETLLLYNVPNIVSKRILLVGCGKINSLNRFYLRKIVKSAMQVINKNSIKNIIFSIGEIGTKEFSTYWFFRIIIRSIKEFLYDFCLINNIFKNSINLNSIFFNLDNLQDFDIANISLKHALAIDDGIIASRQLSNLPPNVCNPLYLSLQAKKLSEKYKDNINFSLIDIKKMNSLGMNAYVAVSQGSKNKPYMSILKYFGNKKNNKVIVLIGKGLTFDSGGISIKPAKNMHEMKYDMCGASAVYGTLIAAAKLNLPLTIIGVLAGCENMVGGNSFRPGDVLTTMSGKTVEVLNTDAEGRLVLCDVLKYVERFSPHFVIDIATLTGACVVALGNNVSGLFSNNEDLFRELKKASEQTDDKIWRLPLFKEYEKELHSNIADLSNIGTGKAGAITAAYFLSKFSKKYNWAHLDIAGTAWSSNPKKGATGRPVELLSQFLLNQSEYNF